ncbi:MAG: SDR family NAD(P)-dependent oxidoreductase [Verrucomicrobiaceae bacterium]|nr:MAG: SDR family NAD(P)-dependent oxidoreductase [Verrucomicrobiaceae bacterium]
MSLLKDLTLIGSSHKQTGSRTEKRKKHLKPVEHQTMVLVGASSGMGRATALAAAKRGARVVVAARNQESLEGLVREIEGAGGQAIAVQADVANYEDVERIAERAKEHFGGFDTWVNFAATAIYSPFSDMSSEEFRRIIEVNLLGQAYGAMVALKHLRAKGRGSVIFISSIEGEVSMPFHSAYAASKHGSRWRFGAEAVVDVGLEGRELLVGDCLGVEVARNVDVDDAAGVDVGRE